MASWYDDPVLLTSDEQRQVAKAKVAVSRNHRPLDHGRIVAELNFGFWTSLYGQDHEQDIVRPTIRSVFPYFPGGVPLRRSTVATPLRTIRLLRNRLSHHEHIALDPTLPSKHQEMITILSWMNPQMSLLAGTVDNFQSVYGQTWRIPADHRVSLWLDLAGHLNCNASINRLIRVTQRKHDPACRNRAFYRRKI